MNVSWCYIYMYIACPVCLRLILLVVTDHIVTSSIGTNNPLWALDCWTMSFHFFLSANKSLHLLTPPALEDLFLLPLSIFSWVFPFFLSLPVLEWRSFWAFYPPPFSPGDLTSVSFALLSILLYFLICSSLLVLDSSSFSIPHFHI